jgi:serine protease Do
MGIDGATIEQVADSGGVGVVRIGRGWGRGAGIVLDEGRVATNAHNVRGQQVTVTFADGRQERGEVVGIDVDADLAVIRVDTEGAAPLTWSGGKAVLGQEVVAVVHDAAAGTRATTGRVSAVGAAFRSPRGRLLRDAIEHTTPLGRGSSGGPLLDTDGAVVGINTHRRGDGFYLALPATDALRARLDALGRGEVVPRRRLGVAVAPPAVARRLREAVGLPERTGLLVREVEEGGPAAAAGLARGDLLVAAAGEPLESSDDLYSALDAVEAGATGATGAMLPLTIVRGVEELTVEVTFPAS